MGLPQEITSTRTSGKASAGKASQSSSEFVDDSLTSELVFALCGPIGAEFGVVIDAIEKEFGENRGYKTEKIKVSELIQAKLQLEVIENESPIERKRRYIEGGDKIRSESKQADILAAGVVSEIRSRKKTLKGEDLDQPGRICFLVDSLKNTAEAKLLKGIYGDSYFMIGVNTAEEHRIKNLTKSDPELKDEAKKLIKKDDKGAAIDTFTQQVGKLFHKSDFFINADGPNDRYVPQGVTRLANIIFGTQIITPNIHEKSMYSAWSAASNSACLSRQVGASVISADGQQIGIGWNDVPKAGGGVYNEEDIHRQPPADHRCYNYKSNDCRNGKKLQGAKDRLYSRLLNDEELPLNAIEHGARLKEIISEIDVFNATEYSRAIHAEMHAMFNALKEHSTQVSGGSIYVTTYPCHNCARHIVLSGIMNIYYISPYSKSLAIELHDDALTRDSGKCEFVRIMPFEGVAPSRYLDLFSYMDDSRKNRDTNEIPASDPKTALPRCQINLESIGFLEKNVVRKFTDYLEKQTLTKPGAK